VLSPDGTSPAEWHVRREARRMPAPIMTVSAGTITAVRVPQPGDRTRLRAAEQRHGTMALAAALEISNGTLARMTRGDDVPLADDPIWARLAALEQRRKPRPKL
jgi:hypothetical protein